MASAIAPGTELYAGFYHLMIGKWIDMATTFIVVYEWIITFNLEVSLVWFSKWNVTKVMYFVNRYLPILDFILNYSRTYGIRVSSCKPLFQATGFIYTLALYASEYTLAMRTCVVWKMNRYVIGVLGTVYVGTFIYTMIAFYRMLAPITFFSVLPFGGCLARIEHSTLWINYVMLLVYDAGMLGLMAYPTIREYTSVFGHSQLIKHVYAEGVLFYVYLFLLDIVSITVQFKVTDDIFLFVIAARMLRSILASRVLLHIREFSEPKMDGSDETTDLSLDVPLSNMRFN